jgi:hypothetical protein
MKTSMRRLNGNRPARAAVTPTRCPADGKRPAALRAKATNQPLHGRANRHTARGRRICDLFDSYMQAMSANDVLAQANALAAAELRVAAEDLRAEMAAVKTVDYEQLIRLENVAQRAEKKLGLKARSERKPATIQEHLAARRTQREAAP